MTTLAITSPNAKVFKYNLALLLLVGIGLLGYIFNANQLVSRKYSLELLRKQLSVANVALENKNLEMKTQLTSEWLSVFAHNQGMVEAKEAEVLYEENATAALLQTNN